MVRWWGRAKARSRGKSKENEQEWEQEVLIPSDSAGNPRARPIRPGIFFSSFLFFGCFFSRTVGSATLLGRGVKDGVEGWRGNSKLLSFRSEKVGDAMGGCGSRSGRADMEGWEQWREHRPN